MPRLSKLQIELMVSSFTADFTRIATFQITNSVGDARMHWLGINEGHHQLSHEPDTNKEAVEKLIKINTWYCEQVAYLAKRLDETPEPGGEGSLLDNTTIVWTNELGKGNTHTLDNIPFVMIGGGLGFNRWAARSTSKARTTIACCSRSPAPSATICSDLRQPLTIVATPHLHEVRSRVVMQITHLRPTAASTLRGGPSSSKPAM